MKKQLMMLLFLIIGYALPSHSQPVANHDTIRFTNSTLINFNVLTNDVASPTSLKVSQYNIGSPGVKYNPVTTNKTITGLGKLIFKTNGTGTLIPSMSVGSFVIRYTIENTYGTDWANLVFIKESGVVIPEPPAVTNQYTLTLLSTTSAGVYSPSGVLVRTLWNNVKRNPGTYTVTWDNKNDDGTTISPTTGYKIKVIAHQMAYTWSAGIGNSSTQSFGPNKLRALRTPYDGVVVGGYLYMCTGFVEGNSPLFKVATNNINYMIPVRPSTDGDVDFETRFLASDGARLYCAGFDSYAGVSSHINSVIYAVNISNNLDYTFSSGSSCKASLAERLYSCIGTVTNDANAIPTGLAVQQTGSYLFLSRKGKSEVRVFNKVTGAAVRTITSTLSDICIDGDNTLYGIDGTDVKQYTINGDGTLTYTSLAIPAVKPINVSVQSGMLLILDAGTHQIKAYNSSGVLQWTHGQSGGYQNSPAAANDKFWFYDFNERYTNKGFLVQQTDGSFWVGDAGSCRTLHFNSSRAHLETISYLPMNYNCAIHKSDGTRVFAGFLEFNSVTGSLVHNWEGNLTDKYITGNERRNIFRSCWTIGGRTFGTIQYYPENTSSIHNDNSRTPEVVELSSTGLRFTGIRFDVFAKDVVEANGDIIYIDGDPGLTSGTGLLRRKPSTGLNGSNNPTWGSPVTISSFPYGSTTPYYQSNTAPSSKGYIFAENWINTGYHLGRVSGNQYVWKNGKSTLRSYTGEFPQSDSFDCGNGVEYAGGDVYNIDSFVVWNYAGEFWKNNQVNVWKLFHQDGLMLLNIGLTGPQSQAASGTIDAPAQAAGSVYNGGITKQGTDYHIHHGDESRNGAIHDFRITGANTIRVFYLTP
jgi:hypothetical protein